jgi:hypothetical protein
MIGFRGRDSGVCPLPARTPAKEDVYLAVSPTRLKDKICPDAFLKALVRVPENSSSANGLVQAALPWFQVPQPKADSEQSYRPLIRSPARSACLRKSTRRI